MAEVYGFNSYVQEGLIGKYLPVNIYLRYGRFVLRFPINPKELKMETDSATESVEVEGLGEVSAITKPKLAKLTISSFFWWSKNNITPPRMYVDWLVRWQKSGKVADLIVTRFNYSMQVTCESFSYNLKAGEEDCIYFELALREYRVHGAKKLNVTTSKKTVGDFLVKANKFSREILSSPVLVEIAIPSRSATTKATVENPYTVKNEKDTVTTIAKSITGKDENWSELYKENVGVLGDAASQGALLKAGTKLTLPQSWVDNPAYNIAKGSA